MKELGKIKMLPCEIVKILANNIRLQKLLISDSQELPTDDEFEIKNWDQLIEEDYMSICPVIDDNITNNLRNSFLITHIEDIDTYGIEDNLEISGVIWVGTNKEHVWLKGNKLRLLEMVDEVIQSLDGQKCSVAGKITIIRASSVTYSKSSFGYRITFRITEQENRKAEL